MREGGATGRGRGGKKEGGGGERRKQHKRREGQGDAWTGGSSWPGEGCGAHPGTAHAPPVHDPDPPVV